MSKYLVVYPDGDLHWEEIPDPAHEHDYVRLDRMHEIIGCNCVEQVRTVYPDICLVIDESGKIKDPPQEHNELASRLYYGYQIGVDDILGPAILCGLAPVGPYHELDWVPLNDRQLSLLSLVFGKEIEV